MRTTIFSKLGTSAVAAILFVAGFGSPARAQTKPDFLDIKECVDKTATAPTTMDPNVWLGFCSILWKLPVGAPEAAFGQGNGTISYDAATQVLRLTSNPGPVTIYFNSIGAVGDVTNPSLVLTVKIGNDGKFVGGVPGACGTMDSFCLTGTVTDPRPGGLGTISGALLRGSVQHAISAGHAVDHCVAYDGPPNWNCLQYAPLDGFEFYVNMTNTDNLGMALFNSGYSNIVVEAFGYNPPEGTPGRVDWSAPFANSFLEQYVYGYAGSTINSTGLMIFDPADGSISGKVTDYFDPSSGVPGAEVSITSGPTVVGNLPTGLNGAYATLANLEQGTYTVTVVPPSGFLVLGESTRTIEIALAGSHNATVTGLDFVLYPVAMSGSAYTTFRQQGWGTRPRGDNAGALLAQYFDLLYPNDLVIGIPDTPGRFTITETSQAAVQDFLPQGGLPLPLRADYVDPAARLKLQHRYKLGHHRRLGSLAGETLALELNVRFSAFGLTRHGLGSLLVASGPLAGLSVDQVLDLANSVLGGDPLPENLVGHWKNDRWKSLCWGNSKIYSLIGYIRLGQVLEAINKNFEAGTRNRNYLIVP